MRRVLILFGVLLLVVGAIALLQSNSSRFGFSMPSLSTQQAKVVVKNKEFQTKIADEDKERSIGLSQTQSLEENQGMLFLFEKPGMYPFWMKNMHFPIDIIFIRDNKIVTIYKNLPPAAEEENGNPPIYQPSEPADKVLEVKAGLSDKNKFSAGDEVRFENLPQ